TPARMVSAVAIVCHSRISNDDGDAGISPGRIVSVLAASTLSTQSRDALRSHPPPRDGTRTMSGQRHRVALTLAGARLLAISTLTACSPLPGPALDPVYLARGTQTGQAAPGAPTSTAATRQAPAAITGASVWSGRYRDNRGEGELTVTLMRGE